MHSYLPFLLVLRVRYLGNEDDEDDHDDAGNNLVRTGGDDDDDDDTVFDLLLILATTLILRKKRFIHSRNRKIFHMTLSANMRQPRDRRIPWASLQDTSESSWRQLYLYRNNQALVTLTRLDHQTFTLLLCIFEPVHNTYSPGDNNENGFIVRICHPNHGQPCLISAANCLG